MSGNEEKAVQLLKKKLDHIQEIKPLEAYEMEMLLVEMLIYKAIICMALEPFKIEEAQEYWKDFIELRANFSVEPVFRESMEEIGIYEIITNFQDFQMVVKMLLVDINKEHQKRLKSNWFAI
ncbi:hypothetical protein G4B88_031187 [Cannabis sativa]|uniref:Uncharacterized protein n=1 Tax=Cannabis sativa TaxID=3483 RepID=A0A7J6GSZ1_CANSA|nr:hypothetical protein G4B88_031187 [Cannabis sativa]